MPGQGVLLGDILSDSGYAHRDADAWAIPLRQAGAQLVQDLHPHDRGPKGTHHGAIISNGNLYCPETPRTLLELGPLSRDATPEQAAAHDAQTAELARYKLGRITADDADGYHRVACPAVTGKIRCPLRPPSMRLDRDRPEILQPPQHPPACCTQQTLTVPPDVTAKTAQKHDYPSAAHRRSYARRTGAERGFATAKDPATNDISRGWCRLMGLAPLMLFTTALLIVRNQRILQAWNARQDDNHHRAAKGLPPPTRRRRRTTLTTLAATSRPKHRPPRAAAARTTPRHEEQDPLPQSPATHPAGTLTVSSPLRPATPAECQTPMRRSPKPKREQGPHENVKTSWSRLSESNR